MLLCWDLHCAAGGRVNCALHCAGEAGSEGRYKLSHFDTGKYMRLDAAAIRALNVARDRADSGASDSFSLYKLLNRGRTAMGKRLLLQWLRQPLTEVAAIEARLDCVEALRDDAELRESLRATQLRTLPDVERLTLKLERRRAGLVDLCRLYQASCAVPLVADALARHQGPHAALLRRTFAEPLLRLHDAEHLGKFEALLEAAVDLDRIPDEYCIAAAYDEQLQELAQQRQRMDADIDASFDKAADDLGLERNKARQAQNGCRPQRPPSPAQLLACLAACLACPAAARPLLSPAADRAPPGAAQVLKTEHNPGFGWFMRLTKKEETGASASSPSSPPL